jgi:hypothetical protein
MDPLGTRFLIVASVLGLIMSITFACQRQAVTPNRNLTGADANVPKGDADKLRNVLSEFVYVGSGDYDSSSVPSHTMDAHSLPTLDAGKQYVFHRHPVDNDALFKTIQERLKSNGFEITAADKIGWRYIGGLFFRIQFSGTQHYLLFNRADVNILRNGALWKTWSTDDYVLVVQPPR